MAVYLGISKKQQVDRRLIAKNVVKTENIAGMAAVIQSKTKGFSSEI
jgi:hypothetical protein